MRRRGFTLPEVLVAGALFLCIGGAFYFTWAAARREEDMAAQHLSMLESAAVAMQSLRTDLREMVVISTAPEVEGTSLRVSRSGDAMLLRHGALGAEADSAYLVVQYDLMPAASRSKEPLYHLRRTQRASDGTAREVRVFRSFQLAEVSFNALSQGDDHVVHVTFRVAADGGDKTMLLTQVLRFLKPRHPRAFALPLAAAGLETPPQDVLSAALDPLPPLPAIEE